MPDLDPLSELTKPASSRDALIAKHSERTGLDPELVRRLMHQESRGKPGAVSPKGASGLMQLMPATAKGLGVKNIFDPDENIRGGTDYLKQQLDEFGDVPRALAAYNAGPGAVRKYKGIPPYAETRNYVKTIGKGYQGTGYAQDPLTALTKQPSTSVDPLTELTAPKAQEPAAQQSWASRLYNQKPKPSRQARTRPTGIAGAQVSGEVRPSEATVARKAMRNIAPVEIPGAAGDWINEMAAKGTSQLMPLAAGVIKHIPGAQDPLDPQRADVTQPTRQRLNKGASEFAQASAAIDKDANRGFISQTTQDVGAGFIGSAPALAMQRLGVPAPVAFGLDAYLKSSGRDAELADVLKETGLGVATGALFSIPVSQRMGVVKQIAARMGIVGGGTYALDKVTGQPDSEAWKNAFVNAVFHATGVKGRARPELAEAIPASKPREFAPTLAPSELAKRTALREGKYEGRMGITEEGIPQGVVGVPEGVPRIKAGRVSARAAEPAGTESAAVETPRVQNRRVRNVATGTKGQFKPGFKEEVTPPEAAPKPAISPAEQPPLAAQPVIAETTATRPEMKPSRLAQGVNAKAVEAGLTQAFEGLPEYQTVNVKEQAQKATELLASNPEQARRIAMGDEHPPNGVLPESVFTAVENRALQQGDVETLRDLATKSTRSMEATGMGQRIRLLAERNPHSAVSAIRQVEEARSARIPKKQLAKAQEKIKTEINVEMKKTYPKGREWASFLDSIRC